MFNLAKAIVICVSIDMSQSYRFSYVNLKQIKVSQEFNVVCDRFRKHVTMTYACTLKSIYISGL